MVLVRIELYAHTHVECMRYYHIMCCRPLSTRSWHSQVTKLEQDLAAQKLKYNLLKVSRNIFISIVCVYRRRKNRLWKRTEVLCTVYAGPHTRA